MTLQKLLLKLSENKDIRVECLCYNKKCDIKISDWWYGDVCLTKTIDLEGKIDETPFLNLIRKR